MTIWQKNNKNDIVIKGYRKICVMRWCPDRQVGALWIANLARRIQFYQIFTPAREFFWFSFAGAKENKKHYASSRSIFSRLQFI